MSVLGTAVSDGWVYWLFLWDRELLWLSETVSSSIEPILMESLLIVLNLILLLVVYALLFFAVLFLLKLIFFYVRQTKLFYLSTTSCTADNLFSSQTIFGCTPHGNCDCFQHLEFQFLGNLKLWEVHQAQTAWGKFHILHGLHFVQTFHQN